MLNNEELTGVLLSESSPTCLVFFCPWPDADQIIGSKPSIGQRRRRPLHFSSRLMQSDGRRKRRRWGRSLHTNPSLITVRAPLTVPSRPDNEFVRWVIHAEVKRCGRSPFYLAALMDERRADFSLSEHSNNKPPTFWGRLFFRSFFFCCSSFRNLQHRRLCSPLFLFFFWPMWSLHPTFSCLLRLFWLLDKTSQIVWGSQRFLRLGERFFFFGEIKKHQQRPKTSEENHCRGEKQQVKPWVSFPFRANEDSMTIVIAWLLIFWMWVNVFGDWINLLLSIGALKDGCAGFQTSSGSRLQCKTNFSIWIYINLPKD